MTPILKTFERVFLMKTLLEVKSSKKGLEGLKCSYSSVYKEVLFPISISKKKNNKRIQSKKNQKDCL